MGAKDGWCKLRPRNSKKIRSSLNDRFLYSGSIDLLSCVTRQLETFDFWH